MAAVRLYQDGEWFCEADPGAHVVLTPKRARQRFPAEAIGLAVRLLIPVAVLAIVIMISEVSAADLIERALVIGVILVVWFGMNPVTLFKVVRRIVRPVVALPYFWHAHIFPRRADPECTMRVFLTAARDGCYRTAYNCLTDSGQIWRGDDVPRLTGFQQSMPKPFFDSVHTFAKFWREIGFSYKPEFSGMISSPVDGDAVKVHVPILCRRKEPRSGPKAEAEEETLDCKFVLVQRGSHWFVCNGFFWPVQQVHTGSSVFRFV